MDKSDIEAMAREYRAGSTLRAIGARYNLKHAMVAYYLKRHGVEMRSPSPIPKPKPPKAKVRTGMPEIKIDMALARRLYDEGYPLREIGERLGVSAATAAA